MDVGQKEVTREAGKYLRTNEKKKKTYKNLWNEVKKKKKKKKRKEKKKGERGGVCS